MQLIVMSQRNYIVNANCQVCSEYMLIGTVYFELKNMKYINLDKTAVYKFRRDGAFHRLTIMYEWMSVSCVEAGILLTS